MSNVTMESLNYANNPVAFGGERVSDVIIDGAERWRFGDTYATRWNESVDCIQSVWNGFGIPWVDQIPLS